MSAARKILLFGKNGQLGRELQRSLQPLGQVIALDVDSPEHAADFSRPQQLAGTVRAVQPDWIINAAAYTAVDKAESEPELAHAINAEAPGILAAEAERLGASLVHYSTDYVFDGSGERPWKETDTPAPLNVYGRTKLEGEQRVAAACSRHLILRTSWVYGAHGSNFAKTMLKLAQERDTLAVVDDQTGAPTGAAWLADLTVALMPLLERQPALAGLYHAVAAGETSWHGYAKFVIAQARSMGWPVKVRDADIRAVGSSEFATAARRPLNSRLDGGKLRAAFGIEAPDWRTGVMDMLKTIEAGETHEST
ncbi:MAG: hypothetical protein RL194_1259 [Pseudomonadota bacterium]|jgi:dTDP-4-dehydrorhamnose reductase